MLREWILVCLFVFFLLSGCATTGRLQHSLTLMTFNVENLFDTQHDPGKNDYTYLPLSTKSDPAHIARCEHIEVEHWRDQCLNWDWNERVLGIKLRRIANAITQVDSGPDIIVFQEVENLAVLQRLRQSHLSDLGYHAPVLLEGNDDRGIDVAFLSKLPLVAEPRLHDIDFRDISKEREADTRGILEASFRLPDGLVVTGFAVHFPAPYHPTPLREDAYNTLNQLLRNLPDDRLVFAAGDFNTTSSEDKDQQMLKRFADDSWYVTHRSCRDCPGTHYYAPADNWSFLDMILLRKTFESNPGDRWWFDPSSVRLANKGDAQTTMSGTPARFELPTPTGLSDHWPLVVTIRKN